MTVNHDLLKQITQSMSEYNSNANAWVEAIAHGLQAIGLIIIAVMMLLEMAKTSERFREGMGAPLDFEVMVQVSLRYLLAFVAVMLSPAIVDALLWAGNGIAKTIATTGGLSNGSGPANSNLYDSSMIKMSYIQKGIFGIMLMFQNFMWSGINILVSVLIFLRFLTLCIFKAISPVMVSMSITEDYKGIPVNFWKQVLAIILQGVALMLICKLYPIWLTSDTMNLTDKVSFEVWIGLATQAILKSGAIIFFIFQSQSLSRRLLGV